MISANQRAALPSDDITNMEPKSSNIELYWSQKSFIGLRKYILDSAYCLVKYILFFTQYNRSTTQYSISKITLYWITLLVKYWIQDYTGWLMGILDDITHIAQKSSHLCVILESKILFWIQKKDILDFAYSLLQYAFLHIIQYISFESIVYFGYIHV